MLPDSKMQIQNETKMSKSDRRSFMSYTAEPQWTVRNTTSILSLRNLQLIGAMQTDARKSLKRNS